MAIEKATFGAGCFWGVEARFGELTGVLDTAVGYEGGNLEHPTYKEVCTDRTGHAEVVQVTFDPSRISYETLLDAFFAHARSHPGQPPGSRLGHPVSQRHLHPLQRAVRPGTAKIAELNASGILPQTHRHPGRSRDHLLEGRGVPPEISRKARHGELPHLKSVRELASD